MLLAGISEFYLLASLAYAAPLVPKQSQRIIQFGYLGALSLTAMAALCGAIRYLELGDSLAWHQELSFYSKHLGMPVFVVLALWGNLPSVSRRLGAITLLLMSALSCLANLYYQLSMASDAIIVMALVFAAYSLKNNRRALKHIVMALALLLSTLLWSAIITDTSLRIAVFHVCLGSYFVLTARSFNKGNHALNVQVQTV